MTDLHVVTNRKGYVRRNKHVKLAAVLAAESAGVVAAERATGIPESTIRYWMDQPQFAAIRAKAREDLAEEYRVAAHLTAARVVELVPVMEPRDAIAAAEMFAKLTQLLTGHATDRTEHRDITESLSPDAVEALTDDIDQWLKSRKPVDAGT